MTKIQMIQTKDIPGIAMLRLFLSLEPLIFEFVSNFDIRISNFTCDLSVEFVAPVPDNSLFIEVPKIKV